MAVATTVIVGVGDRPVRTTDSTVLQPIGMETANSMFRYVRGEDTGKGNGGGVSGEERTTAKSSHAPRLDALQGKDRNDALSSDFRSRVGGLGQNRLMPSFDGCWTVASLRLAEVDAGGNFLSLPLQIFETDGE